MAKDTHCETHNYWFADNDQCPVCEGINIISARIREIHYEYLNECIVCSSYIAGDIKQVAYPCPTIKALDVNE